MESDRFDALTRSLSSRRGALGRLLLGTLGLLGVQSDEAAAHNLRKRCKKKSGAAKKRCLKRARKHSAQHAAPPPCANGVKDGGETDVDCGGGTCSRCISGKGCAAPRDCTTGRCVSGTCRHCDTNNPQCSAGCFCQAAVGTCINGTPVESGKLTCSQCPPGTICQGAPNGTINCHLVCGS